MSIDLASQRKFFDQINHQYSPELLVQPPLHTKLEIAEILSRITAKKDKTVVDFGAGSGRITVPLLQAGYKVLSIDISQKSLDNLSKIAKKLNLKNLKLTHNLSSTNEVNTIVGADILHHVDLDEYLPKLYKQLSSNGKIIFSEPCAGNPTWYIYLPLTMDWEIEKGVAHCSYNNLKTKLALHGFKEIKIKGLGFFPRPFLNMFPLLCRLNDRFGDLPFIRYFAYRYIIEAKK